MKYYCKGCNKEIERDSSTKTYKSFCETACKTIILTLIKDEKRDNSNKKRKRL